MLSTKSQVHNSVFSVSPINVQHKFWVWRFGRGANVHVGSKKASNFNRPSPDAWKPNFLLTNPNELFINS